MPIFQYECDSCQYTWESIEVWKSHAPEKCPSCESAEFKKVISTSHIRMDPDSVKRSLPDPSPPLEELRGKNRPGCEGGYSDKPHADSNIKNYTRRKDKYGNTIWEEKRKQYYDMAKRNKK